MTPLARRIFGEKRGLILALAAGLLANVLVYAFYVRPLAVQAATVADRAAAAADARRAAQREETLARALVEGKSTADEQLNSFYQKVLPADETAAQRMTYASLPAIAGKANVLYNSRRWSDEERDKDKELLKNAQLGHLAMRMGLHGDWNDIRSFIYQVENSPSFWVIDAVTLLEGKDNEPLSLTLDLSTYFHQRPSGN
jgi:hypothetical protein